MAELDECTRLVKGRISHLNDAADAINREIQSEDDVSLITFHSQNYENYKRTCLMDSDLPQFREIPERVNL